MARAKSAPAPPRSLRHERLFQSLEEIFLHEGMRRVSVGELAERLHCSRRALYELAPGKEELFLLVVDRFLSRIRRLGDEAAAAAPDLSQRIEAYLEPGIRQVARSTNLFFRDIDRLPPAKHMLEVHQRRRIDGLRRIITGGTRQGMFRGLQAHLVAEVMTVAYRRVSEPGFLAAADLSMTEAYRELGRLLLHGLLHPQAALEAERALRRDRATTRRAAAARFSRRGS